MPGDAAPSGLALFQLQVMERVVRLAEQQRKPSSDAGTRADGQRHFVMPIALLLVIDEVNGGDETAKELVTRFHLLHAESASIIDFYFMGWYWVDVLDRHKGIRFDLSSFQACRQTLKHLGIKTFGGNADMILVDAHCWLTPGASPRLSDVTLDFSEAIHINLSSRRQLGDLPPLGEFLQAVVEAAEAVRAAPVSQDHGVVFALSDRLGVATAKRSFLTFVLDKFGAIIGARKLEALSTRNIGPMIPLTEIKLSALRVHDGWR